MYSLQTTGTAWKKYRNLVNNWWQILTFRKLCSTLNMNNQVNPLMLSISVIGYKSVLYFAFFVPFRPFLKRFVCNSEPRGRCSG